MTFDSFKLKDGELPLDNLVVDGGLTGIFRRIGCIGDSLSSGEFVSRENGKYDWHDMFDYSWGQYMAREAGCEVYNFSRGGMSAKEMAQTFHGSCGLFDTEKMCQCYIIALGANDLSPTGSKHIELGKIDDINLSDWHKNGDTFAGWYGQIIQRIKEKQPKAKFFLMTLPRRKTDDPVLDRMQPLLYEMAELFDYTYVMDFRKYAPEYDEDYQFRYMMGGHLTPAGYLITARMVMSYIDYTVRKYPEDFKQVPFIGKVYYNEDNKW